MSDAQQLQTLLYREIPVSRAHGISVTRLSEHCIEISAPLAPNRNIHQTAFAGSIFTVATLAGWSMLNSHLWRHDIQADVVLSKSEIRYMRPVNRDFTATCTLPEADILENFLSVLSSKKKSSISLVIRIICADKSCAKINADFVAVKKL